MTQQWEYCALVRQYPAASDTPTVNTEDELTAIVQEIINQYDCFVTYFTVDDPGARVVELSLHQDPPGTADPFAKAMALLGAAEWELVSMLDGEPRPAVFHFPGGRQLRQDLPRNRTACFKRPVQEGRAVDEPPLTLG